MLEVKNSFNCWKPLRAMDTTAKQVIASAKVKKNIDWAISSEAAKELVERPTTRKSNPERMKFPRTGSFFFTAIRMSERKEKEDIVCSYVKA